MHELTWWYLYVQVLGAEAHKKKEVHELIEKLLPWINPELYAELKKQQGQVRENVDFERQLRAMFDGTWNTNPDAEQTPFIDELSVGIPGEPKQGSLAKQMFDQYGDQQTPGTIREQLFPGVPPSFRGMVRETPGTVNTPQTPSSEEE